MRIVLLPVLLSGCLALHQVQIGEIDNTNEMGARRFDVEVEVGGLDEEAILFEIASQLAEFVSYATMGPRTGIPRRRESLSEDVIQELYERCPSGEVTGLTSQRLTWRVPFAGIEKIRITGYCLVR